MIFLPAYLSCLPNHLTIIVEIELFCLHGLLILLSILSPPLRFDSRITLKIVV